LWGAMGGAALMGLGLALAQPRRPVLVLTGDGEQLMGLGGLATIAVARPANLTIAVLDNHHYGETGSQRSHTGHGVDLAGVAAACGIEAVATAHALAEVEAMRAALRLMGGPRVFVLKVAPATLERSLPARDAIYLKHRFRAAIGLGVS
jgi:thiamine pyrophosphate-dependent acetolactate synthase large subunit-like protein